MSNKGQYSTSKLDMSGAPADLQLSPAHKYPNSKHKPEAPKVEVYTAPKMAFFSNWGLSLEIIDAFIEDGTFLIDETTGELSIFPSLKNLHDRCMKKLKEQLQIEETHSEAPRSDGPGYTTNKMFDYDYEKAKARRMHAEAQIKELDLEKKKGEVVPISEIIERVESEYTVVRQKLLAIPNRVAVDVLECEGPIEVENLIDRKVNDALAELTDPIKFAEEFQPEQKEEQL